MTPDVTLLMAGQSGTPLSASSAPSGGGTGAGSGSGQPCCESGRPVLTDPLTGQTVCSCQYDAQLLGYQRLAASGLPLNVYGTAAAAAAAAAAYGTEQGFLPLSAEQSAFYSPTANGFDLKDNLEAWRSLPYAASMYYPYDSAALAGYPFPNGYGVDLNGARRKNATRETTSTLKAWLNEHRKNPYPTKGEKIMLAIITKMTLTQVSTWFANARRRLKKENKMTWEPRNKTGDDMDDVSSDDDDDKDNKTNGEDPKSDGSDGSENQKNPEIAASRKRKSSCEDEAPGIASSPYGSKSDVTVEESGTKLIKNSPELTDIPNSLKSEDAPTPEKPKIWSLAQTATSDSPPTLRKQMMEQHQTDLNTRLRRLGYNDTLYSADMSHSSPFHKTMSRISQDSSAESSLSSPPLWRASDLHNFNPSDKFGRSTPLEQSDLVSVSPSSTGSPAVVPTSMEQSSSVSPSVSYNRIIGSRFIACNDSLQGVPRHSPMDYSQFYPSQVGGLAPTLDMRTFHHPTFLRSSPFPYPVGFTCAPPSLYHNHPPVTTLSKSKSDDGTSSRCES